MAATVIEESGGGEGGKKDVTVYRLCAHVMSSHIKKESVSHLSTRRLLVDERPLLKWKHHFLTSLFFYDRIKNLYMILCSFLTRTVTSLSGPFLSRRDSKEFGAEEDWPLDLLQMGIGKEQIKSQCRSGTEKPQCV